MATWSVNRAEIEADLAEMGYTWDDLVEGRILLTVTIDCQECGTMVLGKWTPDGVEAVESCARHS